MAYTYSGITPATDSGVQGDNITNIDPTFYGTGEVGAEIQLYYYTPDSGYSLIGLSTVDSNGNWSVNANNGSPLPEGTDSIYIQQYNQATNGYAGGPQTITIDKTAPDAPMNVTLSAQSDSGVQGDGITNVTTPSFSGTAEANSLVNVTSAQGSLGTAQADGNGNWTLNITNALSEGDYNIIATATDVAGNTSTSSNALKLTIDTTAPNAPMNVVLSPATDSGIQGDGVTNNNLPTFTGSAEVGTTVNVSVNSPVGTQSSGSVQTDANGNWSYTVTSPLADSTYTVAASETDAAGNTSATSDSFTFVIDTQAPTAPPVTLSASTDSGAQGDGITNFSTPTFYGTTEVGATVTVSDGTNVGNAVVDSNGQWIYNPAQPLADGNYNITETTTDQAGNVSQPSTPYVLTIDTQASAIPSTPTITEATDSGIQGDGITSNATPTLFGTAEANTTIQVNVNDEFFGRTQVDANGNWTLAVGNPLADGVYKINAIDIDQAGNVSNQSGPLNLTVDSMAPIAPTTSLDVGSDSNIVGDNITNQNAPLLIGNAEAGSTVNVNISSQNLEFLPTNNSITADANGKWQFTPTTLPDGTYNVTATATDPAGNTSVVSNTLALTIDTVSPAAPQNFMLSGASDTGTKGDNITNLVEPLITGTTESNNTIGVFEGENLIGLAFADAAGNWSLTPFNPLTDGVHSISAVSVDTAGNYSTNSSIYNFTVDTVAPTFIAPITLDASTDSGLKGDGVTNNNTPSFSGTTEPSSMVTIFGFGESAYSTQADQSGNWSYTFGEPIADGNYNVTIRATDPAGNIATLSNGLMLTIDTQAPAASMAALSAQNNGREAAQGISNNPMPTFVGTAEAGSSVLVSLLNGTNTVETATVATDANGNWSYTVANNLASGNYQLNTVVSDTATNMSAGASTALEIDTNIPAAVSISTTTSSSNNVYAGDTVTFNILSDKALVVDTTNGLPSLVLNAGNPAIYQGISTDGKTLTFSTQVAAGEISSNLSVTSFQANGSTITDQAGNPTSLSNVNSVAGSSSGIVVGDPAATQAAGTVFRFFNTGDGSHFYTLSTTEKAQVLATRPDLTYEGASFNSVGSSDPNGAQVYRFFDKGDGSHFFTTSTQERDQTIQTRSDLTYEGTSFYEHVTQQAGDVAVYRFFNSQNGTHLFTSDPGEIKSVGALPDYKAEGIAFYTPHSL